MLAKLILATLRHRTMQTGKAYRLVAKLGINFDECRIFATYLCVVCVIWLRTLEAARFEATLDREGARLA